MVVEHTKKGGSALDEALLKKVLLLNWVVSIAEKYVVMGPTHRQAQRRGRCTPLPPPTPPHTEWIRVMNS